MTGKSVHQSSEFYPLISLHRAWCIQSNDPMPLAIAQRVILGRRDCLKSKQHKKETRELHDLIINGIYWIWFKKKSMALNNFLQL